MLTTFLDVLGLTQMVSYASSVSRSLCKASHLSNSTFQFSIVNKLGKDAFDSCIQIIDKMLNMN